MPRKPRVFVSHSHQDGEITERIVADLRAAGADVWVDTAEIAHDDFQDRINAGLADRDWLILVQSPDSLQSRWVRREVNAAIQLKDQGRLRDVIPIRVKPCVPADIPPLWAILHYYDATRDYEQALQGVQHAIGLKPAKRTEPLPPPPPPVPPPRSMSRNWVLGAIAAALALALALLLVARIGTSASPSSAQANSQNDATTSASTATPTDTPPPSSTPVQPFQASVPGPGCGSSGWAPASDSSLVSCTSGGLMLTMRATAATITSAFWTNPDPSASFVAGVDVSNLVNGCAGIGFQGSSGYKAYVGYICSGGSWEVWRYDSAGSPTRLDAGAVSLSAPDLIALSVTPDTLTFSVDGQQVSNLARASDYDAGVIKLALAHFGGQDASATLSNFSWNHQ